jgi:crotonobetainyl-CoA:carnitine CoA-transferase CaiB-like acyl-CoA transferase
MILADLGMEVLKVEDPTREDPARGIGPKYKKEGAYFLGVNRNKKSLALNLRTSEGKEIFQKLAMTHDTLLENFRPGFLDRLGLGYSDLQRINSRIVYCSISGYGQEGPNREKPGHDINYLALGGLLDATGEKERAPAPPGVLIADLASGLFAAIGILAALSEREQTGKGRHVDVSMLDSILSLMCYPIAQFDVERKPFGRGETMFNGGLAGYNVYETKDHRFMALGAIDPHFWAAFCEAVGRPDWAGGDMISVQQRPDVAEAIRRLFKSKTQAEWKEVFKDRNACCEPVRGIHEVFSDVQLQSRRMLVDIIHPHEGRLRQTGNPVKLSGMEAVFTSPPSLGEHTEETLQELGYTLSDLRQLRAKGVLK